MLSIENRHWVLLSNLFFLIKQYYIIFKYSILTQQPPLPPRTQKDRENGTITYT